MLSAAHFSGPLGVLCWFRKIARSGPGRGTLIPLHQPLYLGEYFDTVLKVTASTSVDVEQNVEAARKMYKSEEKSKVVKKSKSGKVKKPKSQKTRASE